MSLALASSDEEMRAADLILDAERRWEYACKLAVILAVNPAGLVGIHVKSGPGAAREQWLDMFRRLSSQSIYSISGHADQLAIEGGIDVLGSLASSSVLMQSGLRKQSGGRPILIRSADQIAYGPASAISRYLDRRELSDGIILYDEGRDSGSAPATLIERLALTVSLDAIPVGLLSETSFSPAQVNHARELLPEVRISDQQIGALNAACIGCGINSMRVALHAVAAAKTFAALATRNEANDEDVAEAARLIIAPLARHLPGERTADEGGENEPPPQVEADASSADESEQPELPESEIPNLEDLVTEAVKAGFVSLNHAQRAAPRRPRKREEGRYGHNQRSSREGRPVGSVPGDPRRGARLDVLATLRAAAPWQKLRPPPAGGSLVRIYPSDLRVKRFVHKAGTSVVFVIDASGSAAMHRLAEAKGAIEALLDECYSRRDTVSVIAFKGEHAERVLPPSRSLTRARRAMAGLAGGGGTPLPSAMTLAIDTACSEREQGRQPLVVYLTDGRGNVSLSGRPDRRQVEDEVRRLAGLSAQEGIDAIIFDTSRRPQDRVQELAAQMSARYLHLPYADGSMVTATVSEERRNLKALRQ